jgi:hypothetical protein
VSGGLPMVGTARVTVQAIRDVDLHGDRYHDLAVLPRGVAPGMEPSPIRVSASMCPRRPEAGDELDLDLLMGQVQAVRFPGD